MRPIRPEPSSSKRSKIDQLDAHWDSAYERRGFSGVSWFQVEPVVSLDLVAATGVPVGAAVVDVGGGESRLVDRLIDKGFTDVSVVDVSRVAEAEVRRRLPGDAPIQWISEDVLGWRPSRQYHLWHDRAMFHFMVSQADRTAYREVLTSVVAAGGFVVIGAFAADGPTSCSGLPVARYSEDGLAAALGVAFAPVASRRELHLTPAGVIQPFTWIVAKRVG